MRPFDLVVFDLDGTLIDSCLDLACATNDLIRECGGAPLPAADIGRMVGDGATALIARAFAAARLAGVPPDALERFEIFYDRHLVVNTRPYDGMRVTLDRARPLGHLAVLTNKPGAPTRRLLEELGLAAYFAVVIAGDGPHPRKPDPAGLNALIAAAGASPARTLLVGDSPVDLATARNAGTAVCVARYGFGYQLVRPDHLRGGELFIDRPEELLSILEEPARGA